MFSRAHLRDSITVGLRSLSIFRQINSFSVLVIITGQYCILQNFMKWVNALAWLEIRWSMETWSLEPPS